MAFLSPSLPYARIVAVRSLIALRRATRSRQILIIVVVLLAGLLSLRATDGHFTRLRVLPESRFAPAVVGLASMLVIWYVWGSLHQIPVVHDEASYLLQAETFARGRWAMPSPPLPAFFEQFHVFVTPTFASKYPPGHAILLVPGIWVGLPGLVPIVLNGLAAALLFMLVRRVTNSWIALLTIMLWLPMTSNLGFRASYFSENTSSVLWLLGWWALLEWREKREERWLIMIAACVAWMAITRPLTAVAFAIPLAAVVLWDTARSRQWRQLVRPMFLGLVVLSLLPLASAKVTGGWRESPYTLYAKSYLPFDKLGFGLDTAAAERPLPADMKEMVKVFGPMHADHTVGHLPRIFFDRWEEMFADAFRGDRRLLVFFAVISLAVLPAAGWFAVAGSLLLTLCYLSYAHPAAWDAYYLEILPLLPFMTACGIWTFWVALRRRSADIRLTSLRTITASPALASLILAAALLLPARSAVIQAERLKTLRRAYKVNFATVVARLPGERTIVFIRYAPWHHIHTSLIANDADLDDARTWFVYDRGAENAALIALAPGRIPYLFDERSGAIQRLVVPRLAGGHADTPGVTTTDRTGS